MLRVIHTADWHLGHSLHGVSRDYEHRSFLDWLLNTLESETADTLIIAGDIFDSANPPASAQRLFYQFLASTRHRLPHLKVIVVGGNHDSPARLEAPRPLLESLGVTVVGAVARQANGSPELESLLVPLHDNGGAIAAWCVALPFLRMADLPIRAVQDRDDPLIEGVRHLYTQALTLGRARCQSHHALLTTGHCYMAGTRLSELSERKILLGNQHALPVDIFPDDIGYVALGHLHYPQTIASQHHIRYSGSPIPLSLDEAGYPHQILRLEFVGAALQAWESIAVPRTVDMLRIPKVGAIPPNELVETLKQLAVPPREPNQEPYLEVAVALHQPEPGLRQRVAESLADKPVRLLKITCHYPDAQQSILPTMRRLEELQPESVFLHRYHQQYQQQPAPDLLAAFHELLEQLQETG